MPIHELEYRIRPHSPEKDGYPVSIQLSINGQDLIAPDGILKLNLDELFNLRSEQQTYNTKLSDAFVKAQNIADALEKGRTAVDLTPDAALRVRLVIEPDASELHAVRWECLCDAQGQPLFNGDRILFSRYLISSRPVPGSGQTARRALIAIANPPHLDQAINPEDPNKGLPPVNVEQEKTLAESGLRTAGFDVTTLAAAPFGKAPATLRKILDELENGYDVFYLVCHGGLVPQDGVQKAMLWLEDGEDPVDAAGMVEGIRNMKKQPRLVVLASCQSAGTGGAPSSAASSTLGALGPRLADAGVPAVVAMQGSIKMTTVARFMPEFFAELAKDGLVDRAMGKARGATSDCSDFWMPTLFLRLSDGIWPVNPAADIGAKARQIFADLSVKERLFPFELVIGAKAESGKISVVDSAAWTRVAAVPNESPYALLRAYGNGRVLVLGHEHMLTFQNAEGKNPFLQAALAWLRGTNAAARVVVSAKQTDTLVCYSAQAEDVGPDHFSGYNLELLQNEYSSWGFEVVPVLDHFDASTLLQAGVVVIPNSWRLAAGEVDAIDAFVKNGGGLVAAGLGWSWLGAHARKSLAQYPMNLLVSRFGASFEQ